MARIPHSLFLTHTKWVPRGVRRGESVPSFESSVSRFEVLSAVGTEAEVLALKHESRILGQWCNPVCGFSMMEQVRLGAVWPTENWIASSMQGWMTV